MSKTQSACITCGATEQVVIRTYKRDWTGCRRCGTAVAHQRPKYPLRFLPQADLRHDVAVDEEKMYDYFVEDVHIQWSEREGREFIDDFLLPAKIDVAGKSILDISGGNGHFLKQIERLGATVALTEINARTIEYARDTHGYPVFEYNLNEHDLPRVTGERYDIIMARACIMFAHDVPGFAKQLRDCLTPGGMVIINHSVKPTLGVMLRVQLDEFSYYALRQPDSIISDFQEHGFTLERRLDETDQGLYVYDHDLLPHWMFVRYLYEIPAARRLARQQMFEYPARDRRRSTLFLRLSAK